MSGKISTSRDGAIGFIVFDHPERHNAINVDMWRGIPVAVRQFVEDDTVHVIVLRGAGDTAFVSGADISEFEKTRSADTALDYEADTRAAFDALASCKKPVIAMIHGYCIGGGVAIALCADLRYASTDATFAIPAARLGLGYHASGLKALVDIVGLSAAKEIFFTARRFSADEALARHLVDGLASPADLEAMVLKTAHRIADNAPLTIASAKLVLRELEKPAAERDDDAIEASIAGCYASEDYAEGVRAFLEKRRPRFSGR